jgi:hypothetical protein
MPGRTASALTSRNSVTVSWTCCPFHMQVCFVSSRTRSPRAMMPPAGVPLPSARPASFRRMQGANALQQQALAEGLVM